MCFEIKEILRDEKRRNKRRVLNVELRKMRLGIKLMPGQSVQLTSLPLCLKVQPRGGNTTSTASPSEHFGVINWTAKHPLPILK